MDYPANLVQLAVHLVLGLFQPRLAQVDRLGQQRTAFLDRLDVASLLQVDTFGSQKPSEILVQFVFFQRFHICVPVLGILANVIAGGNYRPGFNL